MYAKPVMLHFDPVEVTRLASSQKLQLLGSLASCGTVGEGIVGVTVNRVLEDIRASTLQGDLKRVNLLEKKDVHNIKRYITSHILQKSMKMMRLLSNFGLKK
ncbi:hypothetical protein QTP88_008309 [Uroleucon formosanum]